MLSEIKAEIIQLASNTTFARNLTLTFIVAIAGLCSLAELQSQNTQAAEQAAIIFQPNSSKIIID